MRHENETRMLISFFNMKAGTRYRVSDWGDKMDALINDDASNVSEIRKVMREWSITGQSNIRDFFDYMQNRPSSEAPKQEAVQMPVAQQAVNESMNILSTVVANMVAQMKSDEISLMVAGTLKEQIDDYIYRTYGKIEKKVTLVSEFGKKEIPGVQHSKFETVLKFVANDEPVYLAGPAGSGKNVICKQVAEALGLDFYFTNAVTQEY